MFIGQAIEDDNYFWSGLTIWVGSLFFYVLNGVIIREITKIPLRMGYGGWYVSHRSGRRSSLHSKAYNKYHRKKRRY